MANIGFWGPIPLGTLGRLGIGTSPPPPPPSTVVLAPGGMNSILIELGLPDGVLVDDDGNNLTVITLPQAMASMLSVFAGNAAGFAIGPSLVSYQQTANSGGVQRVQANIDVAGNRQVAVVRVPVASPPSPSLPTVVLSADGLNNILIELNLPEGVLVDDDGNNLTAITLPQAIALTLACFVGAGFGFTIGPSTVSYQQAGNPGGVRRIQAAVDVAGNRQVAILRVPVTPV